MMAILLVESCALLHCSFPKAGLDGRFIDFS